LGGGRKDEGEGDKGEGDEGEGDEGELTRSMNGDSVFMGVEKLISSLIETFILELKKTLGAGFLDGDVG
jgi:hypothetical protein